MSLDTLFRRTQRKASLEVSVSFMVKLILAIVVFGFGLVIVRNIFSTAGSGDLTRTIDSEVEQQIKVLMDTGEKIVVFPEEIETSPNKVAVFGLGVLNVLNTPSETEFTTTIQCHQFIPRGSSSAELCPAESSTWTFEDYPPLYVKNSDEETMSIAVLPSGAQQGTYVYNVLVEYSNPTVEEDGNYGITKFRVVVK